MPSNKKINIIASALSLILIVVGVFLIIQLGELTTQNNLINADSTTTTSENQVSEEPAVVEENSEAIESEETVEIDINFRTLLADIQAKEDESQTKQLIERVVTEDYSNDLLVAQEDILQAIDDNQMEVEDMGSLFLPQNPATIDTMEAIPQLDVPLITQKDPEWRDLQYGNYANDSMGDTGCAILSLAMVHQYYTNQEVSPMDILEWSQNNYYVDGHGTSWTIFGDFANEYGYNFYNYGNDFYSAMNAVQNGSVVIASVVPGYFTDVGHILVIRGYDGQNVYVNDPNDDPDKMFSIQGIDQSIFLSEGINYWSFAK